MGWGGRKGEVKGAVGRKGKVRKRTKKREEER